MTGSLIFGNSKMQIDICLIKFQKRNVNPFSTKAAQKRY